MQTWNEINTQEDIDFFMKAKADHQTVMWTEDLDISPEFLYENSVKVK